MESTKQVGATKASKLDQAARSCGNVILFLVALLLLLNFIVPPIPYSCYINQGLPTRAIADIGGIETALTEVLADAEFSKLEQLFDPAAVSAYMTKQRKLEHWPPVNAAEFAAATELYTRCLYAVLRSGRNVIGARDNVLIDLQYGAVLREEVIGKLRTSYIDIANDPWGNLYNIYPGPWNAKTPSGEPAPIPFRVFAKTEDEKYLSDNAKPDTDGLEVTVKDKETDETFDAGFPAPSNEVVFIWSIGQNLVNSQMLYNANGYATGERYDPGQGPEFVGGGDDINNWDPDSSWMRLY